MRFRQGVNRQGVKRLALSVKRTKDSWREVSPNFFLKHLVK